MIQWPIESFNFFPNFTGIVLLSFQHGKTVPKLHKAIDVEKLKHIITSHIDMYFAYIFRDVSSPVVNQEKFQDVIVLTPYLVFLTLWKFVQNQVDFCFFLVKSLVHIHLNLMLSLVLVQ